VEGKRATKILSTAVAEWRLLPSFLGQLWLSSGVRKLLWLRLTYILFLVCG
jgi:hypothetical protein